MDAGTSNPVSGGRGIATAALLALGLGIGLAALDVVVGLSTWDRGLDLLPFLPSFVAACVVLAVGIGGLWALLALVRVVSPPAAGVVAFATVAAGWLGVASDLSRRGWLPYVPVAVGALVALAVGLVLLRRADADAVERALARIGTAAPWIGALIVVQQLAWRRAGGGGGALAVSVVVLAALAWIVWRLAATRAAGPLRGLAAAGFAAAALAVPFAGPRAAVESETASSAAGPGASSIPSGAPRRVIVIVVDTLRADSLSCLAPDAAPTPAMDALAAESLVFEHARSAAPWTLPAMASMFTGVDPGVHLANGPESALPRQIPTLAEGLSARGYRTAAIGENLMLRASSGVIRGFDDFEWYPVFRPKPPLGNWVRERLGGRPASEHLDARGLTDRALAWVDRHSESDFFLWLHYFDPHLPYEPPREFRPEGPPPPGLGYVFNDQRLIRLGHLNPNEEQRAWIRALYDAEVLYTDRELGRLFEGLRARECWDDAVVVLTSDHGEEFWEHGGFEHGHSVYEELLRVPLFVKLPGSTPSGRVATPVSTTSLAPTLLALVGDAPGADVTTAPELASAWPAAIAARPIPARGQLYYEPHAALFDGSLKLVRSLVTGATVAYDLTLDPGEHRPIDDPESLARLAGLAGGLDGAADELRERLGVEAGRTDITDDERAELRALGYVD